MSAAPLLVEVGCGHLVAALSPGPCPLCGAARAPLAAGVLEARAPVHVDHEPREAYPGESGDERRTIISGDRDLELIAQPLETPERVAPEPIVAHEARAPVGEVVRQPRALGVGGVTLQAVSDEAAHVGASAISDACGELRPEHRPEHAPAQLEHRETIAGFVERNGGSFSVHSAERLTEGTTESRERIAAIPTAQGIDLRAALQFKLAFRYLRHFVRFAFPVVQPGVPFEEGPHIDAIADHLQWQLEARARLLVMTGGNNVVENLLINIPPRCLKSTIVSVCAVAWAWLHWPNLKILALSTNPRVANRDGDGCLGLIRSNWYATLRAYGVLHLGAQAWTVRTDKDGATMFANTAGGSRAARGLDGAITGEGGDWIIIDDPHDARHSAEVMQQLCADYDKAIHNRVNSPRTAIRTCVMQRLNVSDFSAHVLGEGKPAQERGRRKWIHLCLPAEYEPQRACASPMPVANDNRYTAGAANENAATWRDWRSEEGDTLHLRLDPDFLAGEKVGLGSLGYAGQMQQRPVAREGGIFKLPWLRFFTLAGVVPEAHARPEGCNAMPAIEVDPKSFDWITITVDATFGKVKTGKKERDNVGLLVIAGRKADRFVLLDRTRRMDIVETMDAIKKLRAAFPKAKRVLLEKRANGEAIQTMLGPQITGLIMINPEGGKASRAYSVQPVVEAGNLFVLEGASWMRDYVEELCAFTGEENAGHDDRVDATTQLLVYYGENRAAARNAMLGQL